MKVLFPEKKIFLVVFILSLIGPFHYALAYFYPPEGQVFTGYPDDALMLALMKSPASNFNDPWSFDGGKVWHNPLIGSVYLFILLGAVPLALHVNLYLAFVLMKFVFAFIYYIVVYNLILALVGGRKRQNIAFVLFLLSAGIGGLIYLLSLLLFGSSQYLPVVGYAFTREFDELAAVAHSLTHVFRLYYVIPETLGYLSVLFFMHRERLFSGIALGLAFLFYPMHGIAFSVVLLLYSLISSYSDLASVKKVVKELVPVYIPASLFLLFWVVPSLQRPYYFESSKLVFEALPTLNLVISFFFSLALVAYFVRKKPAGLLGNKKFVFLFLVVLAAFALENIYPLTATSTLFSDWTKAVGVFDAMRFFASYSLFIELTALLLSVAVVISLVLSKADTNTRFLLSWLVLLAVLSGLIPSNIGFAVNTVRFAPSLILPVSVLAAYGLFVLSKSFNLKHHLILAAIIFFSLPSLLGYNIWLQKSIREGGVNAFLVKDEYDALLFLRQQPYGAVLSSIKFGVFLPYYSDKNALLFSGRTYPGALAKANADYAMFFSSATAAETKERILRKYNITYIVVSEDEADISLPNTEKIRDGETKIYRVVVPS